MKKVMKALVAVPVLVGIAAVPALAEDRLSLKGEMRVRGWVVDEEVVGTRDDTYFDQRMRVQGKIAVSEGVSVHFRFDATEEVWGDNSPTFGAGRMPGVGGSMQWDRAYMELEKGMVKFQAGQIYSTFSPSEVVNAQDNGFNLDIKAGVPVKLFAQLDDNGSRPAVAATATTPAVPAVAAQDADDIYLFGVDVMPSFGDVKTEFFGAGWAGGEDDFAVYVAGAAVTAPLGMATLIGEINYFFGEVDDTTDAMGLQGWLAANLAVTDTITIQPALWYAQAADDGEQQFVVLGNDFAGFDPVWDVGTKLSNEQIDLGRPFDWTGAGAGVMGATLKAFAKLSDDLNVGASLGYLTVEDDDIVDADAIAIAAGLVYKIMDNTSLHAQVQWLDAEVEGEDGSDFQAGVGLFVGF